MRIIPTRIHGLLDYLVGALLIASPWLFGFDRGGVEAWPPVLLGLGALLYSVFTDYEMGAVRRLPMPTHLLLDAGGGALLAASPWLLGFADHVWQPHLYFGLFEIAASFMTQRQPSRSDSTGLGPAAAGSRPQSGAARA